MNPILKWFTNFDVIKGAILCIVVIVSSWYDLRAEVRENRQTTETLKIHLETVISSHEKDDEKEHIRQSIRDAAQDQQRQEIKNDIRDAVKDIRSEIRSAQQQRRP